VSSHCGPWGVAVSLVRALAFAVAGFAIVSTPEATADPDALWWVVHEQCVPAAQQRDDPAPCAWVDLSHGEDRGYVVLKDVKGNSQYLLVPTARISGIESPVLLEPDSTNYLAAAWDARSFVEQRAGGSLPRDWMSLATNDMIGRSQDQLHIHIDCLRADVHEALRIHGSEIGPTWAPFSQPLAGNTYSAIAIKGENLGGVNPFALIADGIDGARVDMGMQTLAVVGRVDSDGQPGFIVLADQATTETRNLVGAERLQDHTSCEALISGGK